MKFQHLVLTRYAQKMFYHDFSREWLEDRIRLFSSYCVPSLENQTLGTYSWLVFCDETIERDYTERILASADQVPQLRMIVPTSRERGIKLPEAIPRLVEEDTDVLITSRLDTDDSLHSEAIATIQSYLHAFTRSPYDAWALNFPRGYRYDETSGRLYAAYWAHGGFMSVFEKLRVGKQKVLTAHHRPHPRLHHHMPLHFDESIPAWLQVIHGLAESTEFRGGVALTSGNRSSQIRRTDVEVDRTEIENGFNVDLAHPPRARTPIG
jgi:hypothetical protein